MAIAEHDYAKFLTSRAGGYAAEQWLVDFLSSSPQLTDVRRYDDQNLTYDVTAVKDGETVSYEVKLDGKAYDSFGACYLEAFNSGKKSGILTTTADWWVHLIGDKDHAGEALFFRPADLLKLALRHNRLIACGQGPSYCFKIPTDVMRSAAKRNVPHGLV